MRSLSILALATLCAFSFCIGFVVNAAVAPETKLVTFDGTWWDSLSRSSKITAIEGMLGRL